MNIEHNAVLAWHFTAGWKLRDGQKLIEGKTYIYDGEPIMCECGYHASERILYALAYAPGTVVSRVECEGITDRDNDKFVCTRRTVLWAMDIEMILHEFACRCAEHTIKKYCNGDKRSYDAIDVKRKWMRGEATIEDLHAVQFVSQSTAKSSARYAIYSAARYAIYSAARYAAQSAVQSSARYANYSAAQYAQNRLLRNMVLKAKEQEDDKS